MNSERSAIELQFSWADGATDSDAFDISGGAFGTLLVPTGSTLVGKALQFIAVPRDGTKFTETPLLSTAKTLVAGANALSQDEIRECGAVNRCRLRVDSAVSGAASIVLLWKA